MKTTTRSILFGLSILSVIVLMACAPASEVNETDSIVVEETPQEISEPHFTGDPGE